MKRFTLLFILFTSLVLFTACQQEVTTTVTSTEPVDCTTPLFDECKTDRVNGATVQTNDWPEYSISNAVIYEVNVRDYTSEGTFQAFKTHLERLKELGVDVLWFMPIYPISEVNRVGSLGSPYSVGNYTEVNPDMGTKADFKDLVDTAHEMGFTVLLDWVANHTGWDNPWITDHKEWYTQDSSGNIISPLGMGWNDVADLNYSNLAMRQGMIDAMKYWVINFNIDGFRCDYAGGVPQNFWEDARQQLESIKPLFMLAEDESNFGLLNSAFDANYSFSLESILDNVATGKNNVINIKTLLNKDKVRYPNDAFPMYYTTNHDINYSNGSVPIRLGRAANAMNALVFTLPGMPLIYTGQEVGNMKSLKFFDKDSVYWGNWQENPTFHFYQALVELKKTNPALWQNDLRNMTYFSNDQNYSVMSYIRTEGTNKVVVLLNLSKAEQDVTVQFGDQAGIYLDYFDNEVVRLHTQETFHLAAWDYLVFIQN